MTHRTRPPAPDFRDLATIAAGKADEARTAAEAITVRRDPGNPWAEDYASAVREALWALHDAHQRHAHLYATVARDEAARPVFRDGVSFVGVLA